MKRELIAVGLTSGVVCLLLVVASPAAAIQVSVTADEQVRIGDGLGVETTAVDLRPDDEISVDQLVLVVSGPNDGAVQVHFTPDGTVLAVRSDPNAGGPDGVRLERLRRTLVVARLDPVESSAVGYGAGGERTLASYRVVFDSRAFEPGTYDLQVTAHAGSDRSFGSNTERVAVVASRGGG